MRVLSIRQPWAWCIASSTKRIENRSRFFRYRGPLAIHAGLTVDDWALEHAPPVLDAIRDWRRRHPGERLQMPTGGIVAVAELVDCHVAAGCCAPWGEPLIHHLRLEGVRALKTPVPLRGRLGLFRLDDDELEAQLMEGLRRG